MNRIIEAATAEFNRFGYFGTTTAAVAERAGVTEALLFRHFGSKANLFRETIFLPLSRHLKNFLEEHLPEGADERDSKLYTTELQQFISEHAGPLTSLIFTETYGDGTNVGVSEIDSLRTYFERGAASVRRRAKHRYRIEPDLFVRITFVTVLGCILFKPWIFPRGMRNGDRLREAINEFIAIARAGNEDTGSRSARAR